MSIKCWDWEKNFDCIQVFEGHVHYVMMVRVNPRYVNDRSLIFDLREAIPLYG